jgi:hypothetical protein
MTDNVHLDSNNLFKKDVINLNHLGICGSSYNKYDCFNSDPRLFNAASRTWIKLDKQPIMSTMKLDRINSDRQLDNYGKWYKSYADVNAGNIQYYITTQSQNTFFEPLFSKKSVNFSVVYKDPMDNMRAQHYHISDKKNNQCDSDYCLSYINDTQNHREDILSRQMRRSNESRYVQFNR